MTTPSSMNAAAANSNPAGRAVEFIDSVLRLQPRLAVFDCDGTLWAGDAGEGFFDWELQRGVVSSEIVRWARARYKDYKAGTVSEDDMCGEMVTMHRGMTEAEVQLAGNQYFEENAGELFLFAEMRELVRRVQESGCDVWAVSSTNEWVIRAGMKYFAIPEQKILAAAVRIMDGKVTDELVRVPSGDGKVRAIQDAIKQTPDVAFGNSIWDASMLRLARHPFVVNPTAQLEQIAAENNWPVYYANSVRPGNQS